MKRGVKISVLALVSAVLLSTLAMAYVPINMPAPPLEVPAGSAGVFQPVAKIAVDAINGFSMVLSSVLGAEGLGDWAFAKFLLFILVALVLFKPANRITGDKTGLSWAIAGIVSLLGVFWLPKETIITLLLPYNTIGIVLATFVPLALIAYFIEDEFRTNSYLRRAAWAMTGITFLGLWIYRLADVQNASLINPVFHAIYLFAIGLCAVAVLFDHYFHAFLIGYGNEKMREELQAGMRAEYMGQLAVKEEELKSLRAGGVKDKATINAYETKIAAIREGIRKLKGRA